MGKGELVVPVRLGLDPCGFIGKVQGLGGSLDQPVRLASLLFTPLLNHPLTQRNTRKGVAAAFESAASYANAIALSKVISTGTDFSEDDKAVIQRARKTNGRVFNATGVVSRVCPAIGVPEPSKVIEGDDVPF